jgi:hypothetical protein
MIEFNYQLIDVVITNLHTPRDADVSIQHFPGDTVEVFSEPDHGWWSATIVSYDKSTEVYRVIYHIAQHGYAQDDYCHSSRIRTKTPYFQGPLQESRGSENEVVIEQQNDVNDVIHNDNGSGSTGIKRERFESIIRTRAQSRKKLKKNEKG